MNDELLNILSNSNKDIDNQQLMDYLSNNLSAEEKHEFERILVDSDLASDAIDGLNQFKNKKDPVAFAGQLNRNLQKQLHQKKIIKEKHRIKDMLWLYFSVLLIIIIVLITFFLIFKF
ncbi:MAG: hypothetical protein ACTHK0_09745, partial [Ginsengibacter sp.]